MEDTNIFIPRYLIRLYEAAKQAHISHDEKLLANREKWRDKALRLFRVSLEQIIVASRSEAPEAKRFALQSAFNDLNTIIIDAGLNPIPSPTDDENGDPKVPPDIIELYQQAKDGFLRYDGLLSERDLTRLPRFRDTLDHIVYAAQAETNRSKIEELANAKEHLMEIAAESPEAAVREALNRVKKIRFSKFYSLSTLIQNRSPSITELDEQMEDIGNLLA